ncbi:MAG: methyltransferase, TIGR04325 family [Cytophagales bacterium]|nr:methyltransferase, TIGR04325 family [Bernardetiaceae bacterium]MDW8204343.1 methyltransferase, TIGR04325 family [Cytophagales bacterium]
MIQRIIHKIRDTFFFEQTYPIYWKGNFPDWETAMQQAKGYDDAAILERIKKAAMAVKEGKALFERDGKLFYKPFYDYPLLSFLLKAALENNGKLRVLDFGGSLGSTWFQHRALLQGLDIQWYVVEQPHYVALGQELFQGDKVLQFYYQAADIPEKAGLFVLASGVFNYIENYQNFIQQLLSVEPYYCFVHRIPLYDGSKNLITCQFIQQDKNFRTSFPSWIFSQQHFLAQFTPDYQLLAEGKSLDNIAARVAGLPRWFHNFCWLCFMKNTPQRTLR